MSSHIAPIRPTDDTQHYRRILNDLIDLGAELAGCIHTLGTAKDTPMPAAAAAIAFEHVARTVRRTILLAQRVPEIRPVSDTSTHRAFARRRILRAVEDAMGRIEDHHASILRTEQLDRTDGPDVEFDTANRPLPEIIHDLGLHNHSASTPYQRRPPDDIARLLARASAPAPEPHRTEAPALAVLRFAQPVRSP